MIEFRKITEFPRGTLLEQLLDAYSFHEGCRQHWHGDWVAYDDFFYDNPHIAERYGFVTVLDSKPIGHISWDPRNLPEYVTIGHNCILAQYKGNGYGKMQLQEALRRIKTYDVKKIIVGTNALFLPAQKNYESAGFVKVGERENPDTPFAGHYIDYEMLL